MEGKNKNYDVNNFNKCYVFDSNNTYVKGDKILKKKGKKLYKINYKKFKQNSF